MLQNYGSDLMKKSLFTALVFSISADVELKKRTFDIKYKISQFLQQDVPYLRFQGKEGNFVLNKRDIQDERRVFSQMQEGIYIDKPNTKQTTSETHDTDKTKDNNQDTKDNDEDTKDNDQDTKDNNQVTQDNNQDTPDINQDTQDNNQDTIDKNQDAKDNNQATKVNNQDIKDIKEILQGSNLETKSPDLTNNNLDEKIFIKVKLCDYTETDQFYKNHTEHFARIFKETYGIDYIIYLEGNNYINQGDKQTKTITIGGQKFKLKKELTKNLQTIIDTKKVGDRIRQPEYSLINDQIKYHHQYKEKMIDFNYFTVGFSKKYNKTKCFCISKKDGSEVDFSIMNCVKSAIKKKGFT